MKRDKMLDINKIKDRIIFELNYWNKEHNPDDINLDSNLYNIGLDRSDVVTICCEFSDSLKIDMPLEDMEEIIKTIRDLYNYFNVEDTKMAIVKEIPECDINWNKDGLLMMLHFKHPRHALTKLKHEWETLPEEVVSQLLEYIHRINNKVFRVDEIYTLEYLELMIQFNLNFKMVHGIGDKYLRMIRGVETFGEQSWKTKKFLAVVYRLYQFERNQVSREAHKFCVVNTWKLWNDYQVVLTADDLIYPSESKLFAEYYNGDMKVSHVVDFNLFTRTWKVYLENGSWLLAGDVGNGWYRPLTKLNSYKIL